MNDNTAAPELRDVLADLVQSTHRLTRLAAHTTGSTESPAIWRTLSVLNASGAMRLGELAEHSRVSQPTMTKLVRALDEKEWIKRIADVADARAWQIAITPAGLRALLAWRGELADAILPLFANLSDEESQALERAVRLIHDRVERATDEPATPPTTPTKGRHA